MRKRNGKGKKLNRGQLLTITSQFQLERQAHMTLRQRVVDLRQRFNIYTSPASLQRYYRRESITFKSVDLNNTNKLLRASQIQQMQQWFVTEIRLARQEGKVIFYMDETSCSLWTPLLKKTWTNGKIKLPLQGTRGCNRTILGAVGGDLKRGILQWIYAIAQKTDT